MCIGRCLLSETCCLRLRPVTAAVSIWKMFGAKVMVLALGVYITVVEGMF